MRFIPARIFFLMLCSVIYLFTSQSTAAQSVGESQAQVTTNDSIGESDACHTTVVFGSGADKFKICITEHGNLFDLESPAGFEHATPNAIDSSFGDGYMLCSTGGNHGFDVGSVEGGWGAPAIIQPGGPNTLPLTVTRTTIDGKFQLKQTFEWAKTRKEMIVTMALKNVTASSIKGVQLARYFEGNLSHEPDDDILDAGTDSVRGRESRSKAGHQGLMLTALSFNQPHKAVAERFENWTPVSMEGTARRCTPFPQLTPTNPEGFVERLTFNLGTIKARASKKISVLYKRF